MTVAVPSVKAVRVMASVKLAQSAAVPPVVPLVAQSVVVWAAMGTVVQV